MPEAAPWKFRKILRPLFDENKENILFKIRIIEPNAIVYLGVIISAKYPERG